MKDDLKKRFYDILFEPEEDEVVADAPLQDVRPRKTVVPHPIKASDVLYKQPEKPKPERPSPFINYEEKDIKPYGNRVEPEKPAEEEEETYTRVPTISPIYGIIQDKPEEVKTVEVDDSLLKKPSDSHLGTVLSPIYGFGSNDDLEDTVGFSLNKKDDLHDTNRQMETQKLVSSDDLKFDNRSLEDILGAFDDETKVSDREINLFDELFKED